VALSGAAGHLVAFGGIMRDSFQASDPGRLAAGAEAPWFPVRTAACTRTDHRIGGLTLRDFERELAQVAWFAHLGEPSPWDGGCVRLSGWEQWPGPQADELVLELALAQQDLHDRIFASCPPAGVGHLQALFDRVYAAVVNRAGKAVPLSDREQDAWYAPTQCAWDAGYTTALIACVLACGWPVPDDLAEVWNWYQAGHWPSGFAKEASEDPADMGARNLARPLRLLVY
jgi:hypothetical protein